MLTHSLRILILLFRIAFLTLLERKLLSHGQLRMGPNKVVWLGILQPLIDGLKLFKKEVSRYGQSTKLLFMRARLIILSIIIAIFFLISTPRTGICIQYWLL